MKMTSIKWALSISAAAVLVACGGGGDPVQVAASNATVTLSPAAAPAVSALLTAAGTNGITVTAPAAVTATSSTGATVTIPAAATIKLTAPAATATGSAAAFAITSTRGTVSGNMALGSCIFTVTASTDPTFQPVPQSFTITNCNLVANTAGTSANGTTNNVQFAMSLNGVTTSTAPVAAQVTSSGTLIVNGTTITNVTVTATTGA